MRIPAHRAYWTEGGFHQVARTFYVPSINRDMEHLDKLRTWAYTPEINWETWLIYSSKCWLNCIFFFSRTINSFPFLDWIHKSKEHISWTNCDDEILILHLLIPKTWFTMHSFLHCIRLELHFFTMARTIVGSWTVRVSRSLQKSIENACNPTANPYLASTVVLFHQFKL